MTTIGTSITGTIGTVATKIANADPNRSGVIIRNTSNSLMYCLVGSVYTSAGQLTSATGRFIPPNSERAILADASENVWLLGVAASQTYVIEEFRGTIPTVSTNSGMSTNIDAAQFGFLPTNTAAGNVSAWTAMMAVVSAQGGGIVNINIPGTYQVNACLTLPSNLALIGIPGQVVIQQDTTVQDFTARNAGGFTGNTDIYISGIIFDQAASKGTTVWNGNTYQIFNGTCTSATASSITDSGANFGPVDTNSYVLIISGTGANQSRKVSSKTGSTQLNFTTNWAITPDNTSVYRVCVPKQRTFLTRTVNGVSFTTPAIQNSEISSGTATGINPWSGNVLFLNCKRVTLRDVWLRDYSGNGVKLAGCSDSLLENITLDSITWCEGMNGDGVHIEGGSASPFNDTINSCKASPTSGCRNITIRNVKTNSATFGRGCTDNPVALVTCDYLSQNWLGGQIKDVVINGVESWMTMETMVRMLGRRQYRAQDCSLHGISIGNIRGKHSWLPKFGKPVGTGGGGGSSDGYCQITTVNSSTQVVINANTADQWGHIDRIIAVNDYVYSTDQDAWIKVTGVSGTTITFANDPGLFTVGGYLAKISKTVPAWDLISDGGDTQSDVPDHGTAFTTVSAGGASVTTCTLTNAIVNGRILQIGDWIYNNTRSGQLVQLTAVNTSTGVVSWSGNLNYQAGDSVYLCKTYGILGGTRAKSISVENVQYDTRLSQAVVAVANPTTKNPNYADLQGMRVSKCYNNWPCIGGAQITLSGNITDVSLDGFTSNNPLSTRAVVDFAVDTATATVIKQLNLTNIYVSARTATAGVGILGNNLGNNGIRIDQVSISHCALNEPQDWLFDVTMVGTDGSSATRVYVSNCTLGLYGINYIRKPGQCNVAFYLNNCHIGNQGTSPWFDAQSALSGADVIKCVLGGGNTFSGTYCQSRYTMSAGGQPNLASAGLNMQYTDLSGAFTFSADHDMQSDANRLVATYVYTGAGGHTLTFPQYVKLKGLTFKIKNRGGGNLTVSKASADGNVLFDTAAAATVVLAANATATFVNDGTYWVRI